MFFRIIVLIANPEKAVIKLWNSGKMPKDGVTLAAIPNNKPHATSSGIFENRSKTFGVSVYRFSCIHQHKACMLSMKIKDGLLRDES